MGDRLWVIGLAVVLLAGCGGKGPQQPSQRKGRAPEADSAQLALMELNMQLAQTADAQLMQVVQAQDEPYALYEANVWIHIIDPGDTGQQPLSGERCSLRMRTYTLNGRLLEDVEGTYTLGKRELPTAVEMNIGELHPGAKVRMYAPWYTAYGAQGTAHVPPYENVMIELELR